MLIYTTLLNKPLSTPAFLSQITTALYLSQLFFGKEIIIRQSHERNYMKELVISIYHFH